MKRLLLDTNIYGELIFDRDFPLLKENIKDKFVAHGFRIVREELRDVPKSSKVQGKNMRIGLLHIYDEIIKKEYPLTEEIERLGAEYYKIYHQLGSIHSYDKMRNDFLIVACATLNQVDLVVSEDNKTLLVENALKAYDQVNQQINKKIPDFIGYLEFKRLLLE